MSFSGFALFAAPATEPAKLAAKPEISLVASVPVTDETGTTPGRFTLKRTGNISAPLTVLATVKGTAKAGPDYRALPRSVVFPAGATEASLEVAATSDFETEPDRTVIASIGKDPAYIVAKADTATVTIKNTPPTLYVATLRPVAAAPESSAYGTAVLRLSPDRTVARVSVSYANLSSPLVVAHLKYGDPGQEGAYLTALPPQPPANLEWTLKQTGALSLAAVQTAIERGRIYVAVDTKNHPSGELRGQFIRGTGSMTFQPPPAPPKLPASTPSPRDVARFLTQATFGPTQTAIDDFIAPTPRPNAPPPKPQTYAGWINDQIAIPPSSHLALTRADWLAFPPKDPKSKLSNGNRQNAWWQIALTGPDQLRQRVAFALSELFVVSDVNDVLAGNPEATAAYYDLIAAGAFGTFRDLLEQVTRSPIMGAYLSHLKNARGDPKRGTSPDENYAREVMQLFTIGLNELQPDGTYRLDREGSPIPTYDQGTITEMARVFTGWGFYSPEPKANFYGARANWIAPLMLYPDFHDDGAKTIIGGAILPAGQGGAADLRATLDALVAHPNTAPFVSRFLIQRLVTSNPSPAYVYRVAKVFTDNGRGVRGDLGAVVRAVLLDYEARSPDVVHNLGYGKLKEPLLQATGLLRAFHARSTSGRIAFPNAEGSLAQAPLRSPTVFNFFEPDYVIPGPLAAAGLRAPEYQILTDTTAISIPNQLRNFIHTSATPGEQTLTLDLSAVLPSARAPAALIDALDLLFCTSGLAEPARARLLDTLGKLPENTSDLERVRTALDLVVTSPAAAIQR